MTERRMVFFHTRELAEEFKMTKVQVSKFLIAVGLKRWSQGHGRKSSVWYWEDE